MGAWTGLHSDLERWFAKHDYLRNIYYSRLDVIWSAANSHAGVWCLSTYDAAAYLEGSSKLFPADAAGSGVEIQRRIQAQLKCKGFNGPLRLPLFPRVVSSSSSWASEAACWFLPMWSKTAKKALLCCKEGAQKYIRWRTSKRHTHCEFLTYCVAELFTISKYNQPTQNPVGHSGDARSTNLQTQLHMAQTGNPLCIIIILLLRLLMLSCW